MRVRLCVCIFVRKQTQVKINNHNQFKILNLIFKMYTPTNIQKHVINDKSWYTNPSKRTTEIENWKTVSNNTRLSGSEDGCHGDMLVNKILPSSKSFT